MEEGNSEPAAGGTSDAVRSLAVQHAEIRSKLLKTTTELAEQEKLLKKITDECARKESQMMMMKQKIRNTNEALFILKTRSSQNQAKHDGLVEELAELKCALEKSKDNMGKMEVQRVDFQVERAIHEDIVKQNEMGKGQRGICKEIEETQRDVEVYEEYKRRLAAGDTELQKILSGESYILAVRKVDGIRSAIAERDAKAEMVYLDIDEKRENIGRIRQSLRIAEKQSAAKIRKLKREIQEKVETEAHLKQTVEYLERRLDHGVRVNSSNQINSSDQNMLPNSYGNGISTTISKNNSFNPPFRM